MTASIAAAVLERAESVARSTVATHAGDVDLHARFPAEAFTAIRAGRLLSIMVPKDLGGDGLSFGVVTAVCSALGRACASTGLIFAMHQIQVASLLNSGLASPWHRDLLERIAREQLLLASATTEGGIGGDIRSSSCAVIRQGDSISLEKSGTVISYGRNADVILATARRTTDAPASDQVLVALLAADCTLSATSNWDTLGMRGTSSEGFLLSARAKSCQICPKPFSEIAAQSMLPSSHIFWSGVWHGIAVDAFSKAQTLVRSRARVNPGTQVAGAQRLAKASGRLQLLRGNILDAVALHAAAVEKVEGTDRSGFALAMSNLKVTSGELAIEVISHCLQICGIAGFRNDTPQSVARNLRDAHSALVMINNDRIENNVASLLTISKYDAALLG